LSRHIAGLFAGEDGALRAAREEAPRRGLPEISVKPEEGRFLQLAARACGARLAVEIGTLGGYSGIWIARGLAPGGHLLTLEVNERHAAVARDAFERAGVADRVDVLLGDAHETLGRIAARGPFDFCFIDGEKTGYPAYLDWALAHVRVGGVIAAHNAFKQGALLDPAARDADVLAVRATNERFAKDPRLIATIFPAGDGTVIGVVVG
jgi:caffeoyl-CoA O-methyltransferase